MNQDNTTTEKNRSDDADEYTLFGIKSQSYGPSYMLEITDGPDADRRIDYADTIRIAGVHVGVSGEAEIECKEWRLEERDYPSKKTLVIDPVESDQP